VQSTLDPLTVKPPLVLLADDEDMTRRLAGTIIARMGFQVVEVADGREAWDWIEERQGHDVDLLLTDVIMPRMDGRALAEAVHGRYPGIKILIVSGCADCAFGDAPREHAFLPKPYNARQLRQAVRSMLPEGA
jgi:two-component system cell cycle sensor histidine kinase/response regulator CckA